MYSSPKNTMKYFYLTHIVLFIIVLVVGYILFADVIKKWIKKTDMFEIEDENGVPTVTFPFKNLFDDNGKKINIILLAAPFRKKEDEEKYELYKKKGLSFCGISSYLNFPGKIDNPYEDRFHEERNHDYPKMCSAWLHCFREPPDNLKKSGLPLLLLAEADLKDTEAYKPNPEIKKEYDFIYVCLKDNDKCEPGWQSYNRNWDLAKKCLVTMCRDHDLKGIIVGRENCEYTDLCSGIVKVLPFLPFDEFQRELQKCRFIFVPNIADASPRVITEALCYDIPAVVNYNILGGWNNIVPGVTGEFFTNENDISEALESLTNYSSKYTPREWFLQNRGKEISGEILAKFLIQHYPNINNKNKKYATITI